MIYRIILNLAECALCHQVLISMHAHDFRACGCGAAFVDGGANYIRRGGDLIDHTVVLVDGKLRFLRDIEDGTNS